MPDLTQLRELEQHGLFEVDTVVEDEEGVKDEGLLVPVPVPAAAVLLLPRFFFFEPEVNVTDPMLVTTALRFFFPVPGTGSISTGSSSVPPSS